MGIQKRQEKIVFKSILVSGGNMLNSKVKNFIKNFSYTLLSNIISMVVSALVVFIVPKLIGVQEYGYWQLFLFYSSYVPFLQLGWTDGIYLRYGGVLPEHIDKPLFFSQFIMLFISQGIIAIGLMIYATFALTDVDRVFILRMISVYTLIINTRYLFTSILQATNRFKQFSHIIILDRTIYMSLIVLIFYAGVRSYKTLIMLDIIGKLISFLYSIYICRDFALLKLSRFTLTLSETMNNIRAGIKLMFSNTASMLIIGAIRLGIEKSWDVATFGKVSLTLSISKLMMVFINAIGIIMFPILRRTEREVLPDIYIIMRIFFTVTVLGILLFYYPISAILMSWLPEYADSLIYMALLFPMSVYEGKMALLINPYLQALRKENLMLTINLLSLAISVVISFFLTIVLKNLELSVFSIVIVLAFRCILAEILLSKIIKISIWKDIVIESFVITMFIVFGWFCNSWICVLGYLLIYLMYLALKRKEIKSSFVKIKKLIRKH